MHLVLQVRGAPAASAAEVPGEKLLLGDILWLVAIQVLMLLLSVGVMPLVSTPTAAAVVFSVFTPSLLGFAAGGGGASAPTVPSSSRMVAGGGTVLVLVRAVPMPVTMAVSMLVVVVAVVVMRRSFAVVLVSRPLVVVVVVEGGVVADNTLVVHLKMGPPRMAAREGHSGGRCR